MVNHKEFTVLKDFNPLEFTQESDPNELAVASTHGLSGWSTFSATLQKNGDIIVKEAIFYRVQGQLNTESEVLLKIKSSNY